MTRPQEPAGRENTHSFGSFVAVAILMLALTVMIAIAVLSGAYWYFNHLFGDGSFLS